MAAASKSYRYFLDRYHTVAFMYRIVKYEARNAPFTHINVIYWYSDTSVQVLVDLDSLAAWLPTTCTCLAPLCQQLVAQ